MKATGTSSPTGWPTAPDSDRPRAGGAPVQPWILSLSLSLSLYTYIYIYIYREREREIEREREGERDVYIYIYIHTHTYTYRSPGRGQRPWQPVYGQSPC